MLGTASTSLYLLHFPLVETLSLAYALVERPFLRRRAPWSRAREAV